ncbi:MAG: hypothetical protein PUP92_14800, partial [Rhizonema sp. PD38]|nr:hypothetical protein [Rhizonema sp. PD38]
TPKENKPVRFIGNQKGGVGKLRIEVPGGPEAVEIERDWRESGLPPHQWLKSRIAPPNRTYNPALHNEVPLLVDVIEPSATETLAAIVAPQPDTTFPSPAIEQPTVYEVATAELHEYLEAQSQSIAPEPQQEVSTRFSSLTPPTERYMLGWIPGDQVIANSVVPTFERWCQSKPVLIESVQGSVGEIQQLIVTRHDGESRMSFGNWVEEIKSENTTPTEANTVGLSNLHFLACSLVSFGNGETEVDSPSKRPLTSEASPTPQQTLYLVGKTKNDWEGEVVQLITAGPVYHHVSRLESEEWTLVLHAYLQEISFEEAVAAQATLSEEIFADYGLRLGDTVQWKIENVTLTGTISRLTKLGAFIDEGQPGLAWIEYHRIQKVQSVASLNSETNNNQKSDCSQATNGAAVASVEVDYELLSDALKKAANWQEIEQLVDRDSSRLTKAVKEWTPVQKNGLRDFLTSYLESDANALIWHLVDWLPVASLKKSFKQLLFQVRNIMEGLTAPWLNGLAFVDVDDFGLDTEEWTFINPASTQNIKVCDRKDFAVQAS